MADLFNLQQTIPKSNYGADVFNILFAKHLAGGGEKSAIVYTSIIDNGDNTITAIDEDGNEHTIIYELGNASEIVSISVDGESFTVTYSENKLVKIGDTDIDISSFPTSPGPIVYTDIDAQTDNTINLTTDTAEPHILSYTMADDGKINTVTLDNKTQHIVYDDSDTLTAIGNTTIDIYNVPIIIDSPKLNAQNAFALGAMLQGKTESYVPMDTWDSIRNTVRLGLAPRFYPAGYEFTTYDSDQSRDIIWVVRGHNNHAAANSKLKYTMTLETKYVYSLASGSYKALQFDAPNAIYYGANGLAAGTYNFTWNYATGSMVNGTYQFTITKPVPVGGQIVLGTNSSSTAITACKVSTYATVGATSAIESDIAVTVGNEGTNLGTLSSTSSSAENLNCAQRVMWGSNNNAQSAIRQLINSAEEFAWTPQTKFDRPPTWATTQKGLMHGLPADFLSVVQPAIVPCRTNSVFEVDSLDGTTFTTNQVYNLEDKFFLLSRPEIYGTWDSTSYKDGELLEYYDGLTDTERIKRDVNGSARVCWLRSPFPGLAYERVVYTDGSLNYFFADNALGVAPACIIA